MLATKLKSNARIKRICELIANKGYTIDRACRKHGVTDRALRYVRSKRPEVEEWVQQALKNAERKSEEADASINQMADNLFENKISGMTADDLDDLSPDLLFKFTTAGRKKAGTQVNVDNRQVHFHGQPAARVEFVEKGNVLDREAVIEAEYREILASGGELEPEDDDD